MHLGKRAKTRSNRSIEKYVLVLPFVNDNKEVLLVRKKSPDWQRGKLNGMGGHLIRTEDAGIIARKSVIKKAGLQLPNYDALEQFAYFTDHIRYEVLCFRVNRYIRIATGYSGTEDVRRYGYPQVLTRSDLVPPLRTLLSLAVDFDLDTIVELNRS